MKRVWLSFAGMFLLLLALFYWNLNTGSVSMSPSEIWELLWAGPGDGTMAKILWEIRLPRMLAAAWLGGALSVSGFLLQSYFGNPIAGPYILGVSSGAKLVVALTMIRFLEKGIHYGSVHLIGAAFVGAMVAMGFVLAFSFRTSKRSLLIVCGVMIGYICSAITDFVVTFADDANIVNLHNWSLGTFSGTNWEHVRVMSVVVGVVFVLTLLLAKPMAAYQLGEAYAKNAGVRVLFLRISLILLSSMLAACVTAFAGPISFVGIAVPHLVKVMTGKGHPLILLPGCMLSGAAVTLFCDGIARTVFAPTELSISSVTAALLVPVLLVMMLRRQGGVRE